mmetsp:Transcript_74643/g.136560  ORF Transcript_74643/g.136560 Transcript_74643/m.136560 type:complete len:254 (-) Transcript_74643:129-890(-)
MSRAKDLYFAKLAELTDRYDEMADYMETIGKAPDELSAEERLLLSLAYKGAVESRRASLRKIISVEQMERTKGSEKNATYAREHCSKLEVELQEICDTLVNLLENNLISKATTDESKVFYQKMKADHYRYIAEVTDGDKKRAAVEHARNAYEDATRVAEKDLPRTHPIRLGLALNFSVFQYEVLKKPHEACKTSRTVLNDTLDELDTIAEDSCKDSVSHLMRIMQILRDNISIMDPAASTFEAGTIQLESICE